MINFNREDAAEVARDDCTYRVFSEAFGARGISVSRAPFDWHDMHMDTLMPSFRDACQAIKHARNPNGIIVPGR